MVSFTNTRGASVPKTVYVSSVVTEQDFLHRSRDLEDSLLQGKFSEFCERKVRESSAAADRNMWSFLKASGHLTGHVMQVLATVKVVTW